LTRKGQVKNLINTREKKSLAMICLKIRNAKQRCTNEKAHNYSRYGGRGIKFRLSKQEALFLWERDKAYLMDKPTLDRIDNDGDYCFDNCRFLENRDNLSRAARSSEINMISNGKVINRFKSVKCANEYLGVKNVHGGGLVNCLSGRKKTYYGYKWEYANNEARTP
jgi:hypothetical protein